MTKFFITPPGDILLEPPEGENDYKDCTDIIEWVFDCCGVSAKVQQLITAPQVQNYHINIDNINKINLVKKCVTAVSAELKTRVQLAYSATCHFSLAVCRLKRQTTHFKTVLSSKAFQAFKGHLTALFGISSDNNIITVDLSGLPHLLIAGATGSGKSVTLNSVLASLLYRHTPSKLKMIMIDTKQTELSFYTGIPHLMSPVITNFATALYTLEEVCRIMDERNAKMHEMGVKNILETDFPRLLVVIDELADLMIKHKEQIEPFLIRIAQLGRSAGIHLIVCTQRPTVNVVTGLIKANIPARIALQCSSLRDSMTILDHKGAEQLIGKGDAILKLPSQVEEIRLQVPYISDDNIRAIADYWRSDNCIIEK